MKNLFPIILVCLLTTGCASVASKSTYPVLIQSSPSEAKFTVVNRAGKQLYSGTTPTSVDLPASSGFFKNESYVITLNKLGYQEQVYTLTSSLDGWYWGNLLLGGVIGMLVVDPATGAMYKLPPAVDVQMDTLSDDTAALDLTITTLDTLNDEQRAQLQPLAQ